MNWVRIAAQERRSNKPPAPRTGALALRPKNASARSRAARSGRFTMCVAALSAATIAITHTPAVAGPTIIRDERIRDAGTTPTLGRGYSITTNTFQSACLSPLVVTEPSYDFTYEIEDGAAHRTRAAKASANSATSYLQMLSNATDRAAASLRDARNTNTQELVVSIHVDTYYASIDETGATLASPALALLRNRDVPGFFAACGPFYTRSINRTAEFASVLRFRSLGEEQDLAFRRDLEWVLRGITGQRRQDRRALDVGFEQQAQRRQLVVTTTGVGIGKETGTALLATDTDSFRDAIKKALIAMQRPGTGRVVSVEIAAWAENADFQNALEMQRQDVVGGIAVPMHEKKDILTHNGEFLAELHRNAREMLDMHYRTKLCTSWLEDTRNRHGGDGKNNEFGEERLVNHQRPGATISTAELWQALRGAEPVTLADTLFDDYSAFMYKDDDSAARCLGALFADPQLAHVPRATTAIARAETAPVEPSRPGSAAAQFVGRGAGRGVFLQRYFEHPTCQAVERKFARRRLPIAVDEYCMPQVATNRR